jgi:Tol biopolymer transport system component
MRRYALLLQLLVMCAVLALAGCDIPKPPPEIATPTAGSQNPESDLSTFKTPIPPTPVRAALTPLPVGPGVIYFVRDEQLWRIAPDGTGERQLSDLPITSPASPSPDGALVAFLSGRDLYVIGREGGEARKLASGEMAAPQRLGWHPDGSLIGYMTYDTGTIGQEQAWAVSRVGGEPMLITTVAHKALGRGSAFERLVKWSPDANWVAVSNVTNPFRLLRWPLSTGREGDVRDIPGGEIDWAPDSRFILYSEALNGALGLFEVLKNNEGEPYRNEQELVGTGLGEYAQGPLPQFSPASSGADSDLIAYRSRTAEGQPQIGIRRRGGRELRPVSPPTNNPAWSPAGDRLAVEQGTMNATALGPQWSASGLAIVEISGEGEHTVRPLTANAKWPTWGR